MGFANQMTPYQCFVGVDIAATTATIAWQTSKQKPSKPITIEQTSEGFSLLHHRLLKVGAKPDETLVVMEATGIGLPRIRDLPCTPWLCRQYCKH